MQVTMTFSTPVEFQTADDILVEFYETLTSVYPDSLAGAEMTDEFITSSMDGDIESIQVTVLDPFYSKQPTVKGALKAMLRSAAYCVDEFLTVTF